jgi:hypothetical protein
LGFAKNDVPKTAIAFKVLLGAAETRHALRQVIRMVKVGWGHVTVRRFEGQRDEGQSEFRNVKDFCRGQRFHNCTLVRAHNDGAFFFQGEERFSDGRAADFEFLRQFDLP